MRDHHEITNQNRNKLIFNCYKLQFAVFFLNLFLIFFKLFSFVHCRAGINEELNNSCSSFHVDSIV